MDGTGPSRTAWSAAVHRATHQVLESGTIFADPLAVTILGDAAALDDPRSADRSRMRLFIAARHGIGARVVDRAVAAGTTQVVILGAGLDTTAYRPVAPPRVFEVDHPSTQEWKQAQLAQVGLEPTSDVAYVGVDFERESFLERLIASGYDASLPAVYLWLGVVPYLTASAIAETLSVVGGLPGAELVLDYAAPREHLDDADAQARDRAISKVEAIGEPWLSFFTPPQMRDLLNDNGFGEIDDLTARQAIDRVLGREEIPEQRSAGHIVHARR
ncbi:class I SAM-dependent methyltransferase [Luteipulveratus mongoliensis]|uniref:S-adenosyl-L-methionine-dependent methyltransferase n=1 Tax=Luteipulveratus mongoliensis TaxID=571913 RepID=A0A0K1JDP9_9MICO|nr:SAM-dependent methyltransferase [Luteipulveratus mongoliensis]AKU14834.1 hypothetical protein VV02_01380 [Luteipulveratus mongoliensis]